MPRAPKDEVVTISGKKFAVNHTVLGRELGVSKRTIAAYVKLPGAPMPNTKGYHDI